jgi:hypothetical protein
VAECGVGCHSELAGLGGTFVGGYLGGSLGVGVGVYVVGVSDDNDGSLAASVGGALLGPVVGGFAAATLEQAKGSASNTIVDDLATVAFIGGWIGTSVVLFNLTRSAPRPGLGAAVTFDRGHASLGVPLAVHTHDTSYLSLAAGRF